MNFFMLWSILLFVFFNIYIPSQEKESYALMIGIDKYENLPESLWLDGCKNDVELLKNVLIKRFAFKPENITAIFNEQAKRQNIIDQFHKLQEKVKASGPGTRVVFFYSGHGSQKSDEDGDEPDGKDETLVSYDSDMKHGQNDITDDELDSLLLKKLSDLQAYTTVILDCCHSGTGTRGSTKTRSLDRKIATSYSSPQNTIIQEKNALPGTLFVSACQSYEKEPEYMAKENKIQYGMLTYHLVKAIEQSQEEGMRWRTVFQKIKEEYQRAPNSPSPSLEGDDLSEVLGIKSLSLPKTCKVQEIFIEDERIILDGGTLRDINKGSVFCLVPSAEKIPTKGSITIPHLLVIMDTSDAWQSTARLLTKEEQASFCNIVPERFWEKQSSLEHIQIGWDAVELVHNYGDFRLKLYIEREYLIQSQGISMPQGEAFPFHKLPSCFQKALSDLNQSGVLDLVEKHHEADAILRIGKKKAVLVWAEPDQESSPQSLNFANKEEYEPRGFSPMAFEDSQESVKILSNALMQFNKVRNLLKLKPTEHELNVSADLVSIKKVGFYYRGENKISKPKNELLPTLKHRQQFGIEFSNESEERVYVTVIYINSLMKVCVLFPKKGQTNNYIEPGQKNRLLLPGQVNASQFYGREAFKIIVTTLPQDFYEIELPELAKDRSTTVNEGSEAGKIVFQSVFGKKRTGLVGKAGSYRDVSIMSNPPQWTTITLPFKTTRD